MYRTLVCAATFRRVCLVMVAVSLAAALPTHVIRAQTSGTSRYGPVTTPMPDGRTLVSGVLSGSRLSDTVWLVDPGSGQTVPAGTLRHARRYHSATLLPDGRVLILGGIDERQRLVDVGEIFDVGSGRSETVPLTWQSRSGHTATLLDSTRVLVAGGVTDGQPAAGIEIIDLSDWEAAPLTRLDRARRGHEAALLADDRVELSGGEGTEGPLGDLRTFIDATNGLVTESWWPEPEDSFPGLAGSEPADGATTLTLQPQVMLRLTRRARMDSVNSGTVTLEGPTGAVAVRVVPAEAGRLVFVTPQEPLDLRTSYRLSVDGAHDATGQNFPSLGIAFTTVEDPSGNSDESWDPSVTGQWQDWRTGRPRSAWQDLPPLKAAGGVTAISGQVLKINGSPLPNVTLELDGAVTQTDATGRFLLSAPAAQSGWRELWIDGRLSQGRGATYGTFEAAVEVVRGKTTVLPFTIWLTRIDTANTITIPSPTSAETVVTTPKIPGLELRLPAGAVVKGHDGRVVNEISITPIPLDRPPFPLPDNVDVPIYFTIQPGGAYVEVPGSTGYQRGARLIYPNYRGRPANTSMEFWHYEPEDGKRWYVYGNGQVSADGRQVVPDRGVSIHEFTGAMVAPPAFAPSLWAQLVAFLAGDPVDLGSGLFILDNTDLALPDTLPISLTRTYRQNDSRSRSFGIGSALSYDMFLVGASPIYTYIDLVLASGTRVHYERISPGGAYYDAVMEHSSSGSPFAKSRIEWWQGGWLLTLKDGTKIEFPESLFIQPTRSAQAAAMKITDRYGNTIHLTRNADRDLTRVSSPNGRWIELTYDTSHRITQAVDNIGRTVQYTYDASGRLWKVTDVRGGVTEYTYDTSHRMLTIKDPRGIVYLTNEYDANGRVIKQTQADSTTYQFAYTVDGSGKITQTDVTDPRGYVRRVTFNAQSYPTADTYALGQSQQQTYSYEWQSGTNVLQAVVDPLGRRTEYTYDAYANLLTSTRLAGTTDAVTDTFTYEPTYHQLASATNALSQQTTFEYDSLGHLTKITDPLSHETLFAHNGVGQLTGITDPLNHVTELVYEGGDLVQSIDPLGRTSTAFVDGGGRVLRATNPLGQTMQYEYNAKNQVTKVTDPLGAETSFTYDPNGSVLTLTDANNHTTTYTYNTMDRVTTRTDPLSREDAFVYDANGNLTQTTDRKNQVTTTSYDPLDRPVTMTFADSSTVTSTYDAGDRVTQVDDSVGGTVTRQYDLFDRLTSEATPEGTIGYTYDALDRRATMTVAGQTTVSYDYDAGSRLTAITQGSSSVAFGYDAADRRTSLTLPNGIVVSSSYDDASQLTGLTYTLGSTTLGSLAYTLDGAGRRTGVGGSWARTGLPSGLTSATYDAANQVLTWGGVNLTHDVNGNLTSDGTRTLTWDARDQLASLTGPVNASFLYDALGRRRAKTIGAATTAFLYDGFDAVQELTAGTPSANLLTGLGIDEVLSRVDAAGTRHLLADGLGSTVGVADASGVVQTQYTYQPFGVTTTTGTADANAAQFTGRENDETGLYFYRGRYQHPTLQRFISEDPIGFLAGDPNLYGYVFDSPANFSDPTGEFAGVIVAGCLFGAGASAAGDWAAGRKLNWGQAGVGCGLGALGAFGEAAATAAAEAVAQAVGRAAARAAARAGGQELGAFARGFAKAARSSKSGRNPPRSGRGRNRQRPDPRATGEHSTFRRGPDGQITHYETYKTSDPRNPNPWEWTKRYDGTGRPHGDVPTPHVQFPDGTARPATPSEIPGRPIP